MHWRKRLIRDVAALLRKDYTDRSIDRTINRNRQRNKLMLLSVLYVFFVGVIEERMCFVYGIEILNIAHGKTAPNKTNYPDTKPSTNRMSKTLLEIARLPAWNQTFQLTTQVYICTISSASR